MVNSTQIRASSGTAIIQQHHPANVQIQSHPPALHPVSQNTFAPGGAQVSKTILNIIRNRRLDEIQTIIHSIRNVCYFRFELQVFLLRDRLQLQFKFGKRLLKMVRISYSITVSYVQELCKFDVKPNVSNIRCRICHICLQLHSHSYKQYLFITRKNQKKKIAKVLKTATIGNTIQQSAPTIKVGSTQIKPIINSSNAPVPQPVVISQPPILKPDSLDTSKNVVKEISTPSAPSSSSIPSANATTPVSLTAQN